MKFLLERQEPTVYNALSAVPTYINKYGMLDAFLELYYRFNLKDDELNWILDKSLDRKYIDEEDKERILNYSKGWN